MTQSLKMVGLVGWGIPSEQVWRKGPWTPEEDKLLADYVALHGEGRWSSVARSAGLNRTGKSCRLRWVNYLRPGLKRGQITPQEEGIIIELHAIWGNKWSTIARYLPGRTDNEIKNYWRTHFKKKETPARKTSDHRRKSQNPKPQPQTQTDSTSMLTMEVAANSGGEQVNKVSSPTTTQGNNKQEMMFMYPPNSAMEDQHSLMTPASSSWMDGTCQDQDGSLWGSLWNYGDHQGAASGVGRVAVDQIQQLDQYCSKLALSAQNQAHATHNNNGNIINNMVTNNGFSWGGDPNHLYNESYIF